ncbi:winged helix-turn-helix domain-containing protein [Thermobifida halotolerans]|uniref:Winged helix-turn-helix domain-containing protein n=1 Tax=Thermobifida halotolerans TaxID=483545 RepID=A0AA97M5H3_9ACTN|nr:winged helix-turn-helix domain-containing protein [Thermobifida halotolerans]UOE21203.1 winged helix-turn-helix domain-containing protein [Thermobifida halotolerans]
MDAHGKQQRRLTAAALFEQDERSDTRIGDLLGVTARAVNHWRRAWHQGGTEAPTSKGRTGPKGCLDPEQRHRVRRVIAETFGAAYADPSGVRRLLKAMGWSVQIPARRAVERDEEAIAARVEQTWPRIGEKGPGSSSRTGPARD